MSLKRIHSLMLILIFSGWGMNALMANGLNLGPVTSDGRAIELQVNWKNAWNLSTGPANHDAVWIFAKIKRDGRWEHLRLSAQAQEHNALPSDRLAIDPDPAGRGVMLRTMLAGGGDMASTRLHLQLAETILDGDFEIAVFGIEMAYVPEAPFWVGDGASNFCLRDSMTGQPYFVASEAAIPTHALTSNGSQKPNGELTSAFPKGYGGFYLMKYELSQAQYADFLNLLSPAQLLARMPDFPAGSNRNGIMQFQATNESDPQSSRYVCNAHQDLLANGTDDGQNRACNWLSWDDLAAYLDWAALRPVTELEFEKACRGPLAPVPLEFAWGTDSIVDANTPLQDGMATESVAETATLGAGLGSHGYAGPQGPLRCGFGAHGSSDRLQAGAGYYGHAELSGNLWEFCVTTRAPGLGYDGAVGDGNLSDAGAADVPTWPSAAGVGYKGGGWNSGVIPGFRDLAVSDRFYIGLASDIRRPTAGGRGGR